MKKAYFFTTAVTAAALLFAGAQPAFAAEESSFPGTFSGNVGATTEYSFRGIAQSDEHPALQGGIDWGHDSGLYLGFWGSSIDFADATVEMDFYGGMTGNFSEQFTWDAGFIYYAYPGSADGLNYDFIEAKGALGYDFSVVAMNASVNYSPDYFAGSGDSFYYSLGADVPLPHDFSLSGHVAYQDIDDEAAFGVPDYFDWSAGIGYAWNNFDFSLAYIDTDLDSGECADGCDERVIFSLSYAID